MRRMMAHLSLVPSSRINSVEHLSDEQFDRLGAIQQRVGNSKIVIEDSFRADLDKLVALIRKYKRADMLDVAVIDYIQQIVPSRRSHTKQQDMMGNNKFLTLPPGEQQQAIQQLASTIKAAQVGANPMAEGIPAAGSKAPPAGAVILDTKTGKMVPYQ